MLNLLLTDVEVEMEKIRWGGIRLGEGRVFFLAYADDVMLPAEEEGAMRNMRS